MIYMATWFLVQMHLCGFFTCGFPYQRVMIMIKSSVFGKQERFNPNWAYPQSSVSRGSFPNFYSGNILGIDFLLTYAMLYTNWPLEGDVISGRS